MRLIDADALKEEVKTNKVTGRFFNSMLLLIDNAPTVETYTIEDIQEVRENALILGAKLAQRPQGKWYEHINKDLLKSIYGDYVLYKVDYLLDNLEREVNIMKCVRKMRGGAE